MFDSDSEEDVQAQRLTVNKDYAAKYEASKRKQDLQRLSHVEAELSTDASGSDESDESEDDDGEGLTPELEVKILKTINSIRSRDPKIYQKGVTWFEGKHGFGDAEEGGVDEVAEASRIGGVKSKSQRKTYKDVVREQALAAESGKDLVASSDDENDVDDMEEDAEPDATARRRFAYDAEQEGIRKAFLSAADGSSDEDDQSEDDEPLLKKRKAKDGERDVGVEKEIEAEVNRMVSLADKVAADEKEREADQFLRAYVLEKKWVDPDEAEGIPSYEEIVRGAADQHQPSRPAADGADSDDDKEAGVAGHYGPVIDEEDAKELERMEAFESKYNFRFEEQGGVEIISYGRTVEGSARRKDDKRKKERDAYKKRKEEQKQRMAEDLRRLKNLKFQEIKARLQKIQDISGGGQVDDAVIEEDFDPDKWDQQMAQAFGENYYEQQDEWSPEDGGDGGVEEAWDGEWGGVDEGGADGEEGAWEGEGEEGEYEAEVDGNSGAPADAAKMLDELYNLDYEDMIVDLPCRFKYRQVPANDYGLSTEEILNADDADLNRLVSLKKLQPYREKEFRVKSLQRHRWREKLKIKQREAQEENGTEGQKQKEGSADKVKPETVSEPKAKRRKRKRKSSAAADGEAAGEIPEVAKSSTTQAATVAQREEGQDQEKKSNNERTVAQKPGLAVNVVNGVKDVGMKKKKRKRKKGEGISAKAAVAKHAGLSEGRLAAYGLL